MGLEDRERLAPGAHPNKEIRKALQDVMKIDQGERFILVKGGHWGLLVCDRGCCRIQVNGTPRTRVGTSGMYSGQPASAP